MSVRISRQQWDGLLGELDHARRQRHLLTYRALLERLQFPTPAMQTLTAALEHLASLDAKAEADAMQLSNVKTAAILVMKLPRW